MPTDQLTHTIPPAELNRELAALGSVRNNGGKGQCKGKHKPVGTGAKHDLPATPCPICNKSGHVFVGGEKLNVGDRLKRVLPNFDAVRAIFKE